MEKGLANQTTYKKLLLFLGGFIFFLLILGFVSASGFVSVSGTDFYLDGKKFYFAGTNAYYLWYGDLDCINPGVNQGCVNSLLDKAKLMNLSVIRTWGSCEGINKYGYCFQFSPRVYDEATFVHFDNVLKEASQRNLKLTIVLVNNWGDFGGISRYNSWCNLTNHDDFYTNNCTKQLYKDYINYFLNRQNTVTGIKYKDDPTIFAWELANEPRARSDTTGVILNNWIGEMSSYIKSIDSNHMVTTGIDGGYISKNGHGIYEWWYNGNEGQNYISNHQWNTINFATFHYYRDMDTSINDSLWIKEHVDDAHLTLNKPVVFEEFNTNDVSNRLNLLTKWYNQFQNLSGNGDTFWMLSDNNFYPNNDGYYVLCPEDSAVCNLITNHANYMKTLGGGALNDYNISSCTDLQNIKNDLNGNYVLINNIDCSDSKNWNSGNGFEPLGIFEMFTGRLDGNGYSIKNLYIKSKYNFAGLFAFSSGEIKNLGIDNIILVNNGSNLVIPSGIALSFESINTGTLTIGSGAAVTISSSGLTVPQTLTGGFVGLNYGKIDSVYSSGFIYGNYSGGISGINFGNITNSYSNATVVGFKNNGGLAGINNGTIDSCYYSGYVLGENYFGGISGVNYGTIKDSFASTSSDFSIPNGVNIITPKIITGNVNVNGSLTTDSIVADTLTIGAGSSVTIKPYSPNDTLPEVLGFGITGRNYNTIINSYWNKRNSGPADCYDGGNSGCTSILNNNNYFYDTDNAPINTWDFTNAWSNIYIVNYPVLKWQNITCLMPSSGMEIKKSVKICSKWYSGLNNLYINKSNIIVDCNGASFTNLGHGTLFSLMNVSGVELKNCSISSYYYIAIDLTNSFNNSLHDLSCRKNNYCVYLRNSNNNKVFNSSMNYQFDSAINVENSNGNLVESNYLFANEYGCGVRLWNSNNTKIINNSILQNGYNGGWYFKGGIGFINSNNNTIKNNLISYNYGNGLYLSNSINNTFYHNNIINNSNQVSVGNIPNFWDYNSEGNYWSNYDAPAENCSDFNSDGICDNAYIVGTNNIDNFPFTKENGWLNRSNGSDCVVPYDGMNVTKSIQLCYGHYYLPNGINITVNNTILDCGNSSIINSSLGIHADGISNVTIRNCNLTNSRGILLWSGTSNSLIEYNYIEGSISIGGGSNVSIRKNRCYSSYCISAGGYNLTISDNEFSGGDHLIYLNRVYNSKISNNILRDYVSWGRGISLDGVSNNLFENNTVSDGGSAFHCWYQCYNNTLIGNNLIRNGGGLIGASWLNNLIYHNNFINNTYQVSTGNSANYWNYSNQGNYWSNYDTPAENCSDLNCDGICDNPYVINSTLNIKDYFPFVNQSGWMLNRSSGCTLAFDSIFYNEMFNTHMNYFLSNDSVTRYGLPLTAYKVGDRARFGYSNPTEWGYLLQAYVAGSERNIITKNEAVRRINISLSTINALQQDSTQNYNGLFYPYYKVTQTFSPGTDVYPYHDSNTNIPSIDNGLLYMSLLITEGWAKENGFVDIENKSKTIKNRMNFRMFLFSQGSNKYFAHVINAGNGQLGASKWDVYSDEGGLMSLIGYFSDSINITEFQELTNSQLRSARTWNGNTVNEAAWFNSMFTWGTRPLSGYKVINTSYSTGSFVTTTKASLEYGKSLGYSYPGFSDAMTQGVVGYYVPPNLANQVPATGPSHVTPHAFFVPLNVWQDLPQSTINNLTDYIKKLKTDSAGYYFNSGSYPYGFIVTTSPYENQTGYNGVNPSDGKLIFETLSESYTVLSLFNALQKYDNKKDFYDFAINVPGYETEVSETLSFLYPSGSSNLLLANIPALAINNSDENISNISTNNLDKLTENNTTSSNNNGIEIIDKKSKTDTNTKKEVKIATKTEPKNTKQVIKITDRPVDKISSISKGSDVINLENKNQKNNVISLGNKKQESVKTLTNNKNINLIKDRPSVIYLGKKK